MHRRLMAIVAALALAATMATPALARTPGVQTDENAMFLVCVFSVAAQAHVSPYSPAVWSYCLAWLNGDIVSPPNH